MNHRALRACFVGDGRHDLGEIDLLQGLQSDARIFMEL
jgi:hypothetical protein